LSDCLVGMRYYNVRRERRKSMESSTRTTPRKTKKKWSRLEWLLLLAPLLVVGGLALMNFAPQVKRFVQERRDYGNNRPYAVFYPQTKSKDLNHKMTFDTVAFSSDWKYIVAAETGYGVSKRRVDCWSINDNRLVGSWNISGRWVPYVRFFSFSSPSDIVAEVGENTANFKTQTLTDSQYKLTLKNGHEDHEMPGQLLSFSSLDAGDKIPSISKAKELKSANSKTVVRIFAVRKPTSVVSTTPSATVFQIQWKAQRTDSHSTNSFAITQYLARRMTPGGYGESPLRYRLSPNGKVLLASWATPDATSMLNGQYTFVQRARTYFKAFDMKTGRLLWTRDRNDLVEFYCRILLSSHSVSRQYDSN